jgi:hypothetical protein
MNSKIQSSLLMPVMILAMLFSTAGAYLPAEDAGPHPADGDPIWCPEGVVPIGGAGGCSPSFTTLSRLILWLRKNDPDRAGVIWLEKTYDSAWESGTGFTLDGASFVNFDNHALTIQGGWDGPGTISVDHADPAVFAGDFLRIDHWNADVTVNDIIVDSSGETGLHVNTLGEVHLANVDSHDSTGLSAHGFGAVLSNYSATASWDVTVTDSNFTGNGDAGLNVVSSGTITVQNITANRNGFTSVGGEGGASLDNRPAVKPRDVILLGVNTFSDNNTHGLMIFSDGAIEVHDVTASGHLFSTGTGLYLDNTSASDPQPVILRGSTHIFDHNTMAGLMVNSDGPIYAENLSAVGNEHWGVVLNNARGKGDILVQGSNTFFENSYRGFSAFSNGTIDLHAISVDFNGADGVVLGTPGNASITCAKIYNSGEYGINATGLTGLLTLDDVTFFANVLGLYTYAGTPVILTGGCLGP